MANSSAIDAQHYNETNGTDLNDTYYEEIDYCDGYRDVDFLIRNIWMYVGYPILALGTVGHLLVIVLVLLNKGMRSLPLSIFLVTMSASGFMALYVGLLPTIIKHQTCHHERSEDQTTETGCQIFMASIYFFFQLYSWMEASVSVERMCAVRWPLIYRTLSTLRSNGIAVTVIFIVLMVINGIHFKIFGKSRNTCDVEDEELFKAWQYVHSVLYIILPVAIMLPANVITLHTMYRSPLKDSSHVKKAKPIAIMMFILNGIFVVTTAPILVGNYEHLEASEYEAVQVAWAVSRLMMYLGCSLTFLVYVAVAARFRKALSELLVSGKKKFHSALVAMSHVTGKSGGRRGDYQVAECDNTLTAGYANSSTASTTDGKL